MSTPTDATPGPGTRVLVVGLGRSGRAAATALRDAGATVTVVDEREEIDDPKIDGVPVHLGADPVAYLSDVDLVVPSPGVPEHAPVLTDAARRGIAIWSEPELAWRLAPHRLLAVTGTNGKTTVTELLTAMLTASGMEAVACGNIGTPLTTTAVSTAADTLLVAELSSFQLRFCWTLRPQVGLLLNLAPDHLDWHGDLSAYGAAKARLWQAQQADDWAVVNHQDERVLALAAAHAPAGVARFSASVPVDHGVGCDGTSLLISGVGSDGVLVALDELPQQAPHHVANVAAAATGALLAGARPEAVATAARTFRPGRHRLEQVAAHGGVRFVDDSKATNPHAAAAALQSADRIIWIAGGLAKGVDLGVLGSSLGAVRHAVLIGAAADELERVCRAHGVPSSRADSIEEAVRCAAGQASAGDTVLLAPACASFDQFRDYAERGDRFAAAARALDPKEVGA